MVPQLIEATQGETYAHDCTASLDVIERLPGWHGFSAPATRTPGCYWFCH